jgi:hypothetical protein
MNVNQTRQQFKQLANQLLQDKQDNATQTKRNLLQELNHRGCNRTTSPVGWLAALESLDADIERGLQLGAYDGCY